MLDAPREGMIGDTVKPGTTLRVTADGLRTDAVVRVRADGEQLLEETLTPGGEVRFSAPREAGWVRAMLLAPVALPIDTTTDVGNATPQRDGMPLLALTSPMYVRRGHARRAAAP